MIDLGVSPDAPGRIPDVVDRLAPTHVAFLMGITGDDLTKALTKTGAMATIRPKNKFINWVYSRARKTASSVGKVPEDIGFSKEAIGDVYDQMFRAVGLDPKAVVDEPLTPAMSQLEEVRQELHRIQGTAQMTDNDYLKYQQYINKVADGLEQTPMFRPEVSIVHKGTEPVGIDIADKLGVRFEGIQEGFEEIPSMMMFTDVRQTGSTFTANTLDEATTKLANMREAFGVTAPELGGVEDWWAKKESAMMKAREAFELDFTDYSNRNMVDAAMRTVFPFWTYEWQRWFWVPRTFLKTPGVATGMGRYIDYSDQGYTPLPGTNIQFNPLRGTVFMGGFRRLYLRDFPEYYDAFPGMEVIDYISRLGFYPGIHVMLPIVLFGAATGKPEFGEVAPAWAKTTLDAARAVAPEQAGKVINHIFPDRFRDYMTMLTLAADNEDAEELWRKKQPGGVGLSEEEERLWLRAEADATGLKGVLFEQTGLFRLRPEEYTQLNKDMGELIEELTGVPVRVQDVIRRRQAVTGKRFSDYFKLDVLQQKVIYEDEAFRRFQGLTTPLYPSTWQAEDVRTRDYYSQVDEIFTQARYEGKFDDAGNLEQQSIVDLTTAWIDGELSSSQWVSARGDILSGASAASDALSDIVFPDVPKTLAEREARLKERGLPAPTYGPDQVWKLSTISADLASIQASMSCYLLYSSVLLLASLSSVK